MKTAKLYDNVETRFIASLNLAAFTLLEMLLVLIIIAILLLATYNQYQKVSREKDIAFLKQNISLLQNQLNACYQTQLQRSGTGSGSLICTGNFDPTQCPLPNNLLDIKFVNNKSSDYKYAFEKFEIKYKDDEPCSQSNPHYNYQLKVTATLSSELSAAAIKWIAAMTNVSTQEANELTWVALPGYFIEGINSHLWVLESELRSFKKAQPTIGS